MIFDTLRWRKLPHACTIALLLPASFTPLGQAQKSSAVKSHLHAPVTLRCANQREPLAVAEPEPEFSWQLTAANPAIHGIRQSAYQIQVVSSSKDSFAADSLLWDSGVVHRQDTFGIRYHGPALAAARSYAWHVRVWDEQGRPSAWSSAGQWMQAPAWHAHWIAAPLLSNDPDREPLPIFRKAFTLQRGIERAVLYASGLGQDELRLNGKKVGNDLLTPGWSDYRKTVYFDTYDVTSMLRSGENVLGVLLGNGMYRVLRTQGRYTKFTGSYGPPKFALLLHLQFKDGRSVEISSDTSWKTLPGPITFSSTYGGEDFDARREPRGWDAPGFRDTGWKTAEEVLGPGGSLMPELAPPIRVARTYAPIAITHPRPGITIYDLGQNFAGWPEITVSGPSGAVVKLIPGELLNSDGTVSQRSSGGPQWFTYTLRGDEMENWHPRFSYYGFRYVQVETTYNGLSSDQVRVLNLRGEAVHSSAEATGSFDSSDTLLNRIHALILRAIENNAQSLFTDCPHREKLGWLEETHLLADSMLYDYDFAGLYAATARNIADAQTADGPSAGRVPEIAPQYVVFGPGYGVFDDSPEWGSAAVLAPWYVYRRNGDLKFLANQLDVMRRYVTYLGTRAHKGIVDYGLGDWYDIGPGAPGYSKLTTPGVTATAIYYQDLLVLQRVTALLGNHDESRIYARQAEQVRESFNARFFDAALHRYDKGSQTAQAMPLVLGLVPATERANVLNALVRDIRTHGNHVTAGDIGYHYVVDALLDAGRSDVLMDMLERTDAPSYGYQLARGATALTEAWDANPANSQDHFMLGDAEEWFYRGLGGINVDFSAQGAQRLILRPAVVDKLHWVRVGYQSRWGLIESAWQRSNTAVNYDFAVPVNTIATIELKAESYGDVMVNGVGAKKAAGVTDVKQIGNTLEMTVGSGRYDIRVLSPRAASY